MASWLRIRSENSSYGRMSSSGCDGGHDDERHAARAHRALQPVAEAVAHRRQAEARFVPQIVGRALQDAVPCPIDMVVVHLLADLLRVKRAEPAVLRAAAK